LLAILKKHNGIDEDYYYHKMDRNDVKNAISVSGISNETFDWMFEEDEKDTNIKRAYITG
jgi:hypothetical protein